MRVAIFTIILIQIYQESVAIDCSLEPKSNEAKLRKHLFCEYDKSSRPVIGTGPVKVLIKLVINKFDYNSKSLSLSTWTSMTWTDEFLRWNPRDFNGATSIIENSDIIWFPDITTYSDTTVGLNRLDQCTSSNCVIQNTGQVSCIPPCTYYASCNPDFTYWPYDTQNCTTTLGTWAHRGNELQIQPVAPYIEKGKFTSTSGDWRMTELVFRHNTYNESGEDPFTTISYSFIIERHSTDDEAIIVVPAFMLILLNLIVQWIDPEVPQRINVILINIFIHIYMLNGLVYTIPENGDSVPLIIYFIRNSLVISGFILLNTLFVRSIYYCDAMPPGWIESIVSSIENNRFGRFFFTRHLVPGEDHLIDDDVTILVESEETNVQTMKDKPNRKMIRKSWKCLSKLIDRLWFLALFITYLIMVIAFIPVGYKVQQQDDVHVISIS